VEPERTIINVGRQVPEAPGSDGDEEQLGPDALDPQDEPAVVPDRNDNGPVFDLADGPEGLFDRQDLDPDEERDDADGVEVRRGGRRIP
jgi:hypothetical protein